MNLSASPLRHTTRKLTNRDLQRTSMNRDNTLTEKSSGRVHLCTEEAASKPLARKLSTSAWASTTVATLSRFHVVAGEPCASVSGTLMGEVW